MSTFPVNTLDTGAYFGTSPVKNKSKTLDADAFLRLMITQLANQNPLEPVKDTEYYAQMAQLGTVQGIDELKNSMEVQQASGMLGKFVTGIRNSADGGVGSGQQVSGIVRGTSIKDGSRYLQVEEANGGIAEIEMKNVTAVRDAGASNPLTDLVTLSQAGGLIGKTITAPHPVLKGPDGKPLELTGSVKKVSFESGSIQLTVMDSTGKDVKVNLLDVQSFAG